MLQVLIKFAFAFSVDEDGEFNLGRLQVTFRYSIQRNALVVVIHKIMSVLLFLLLSVLSLETYQHSVKCSRRRYP